MRGSARGHEENSPTDFRQPNNLLAPSPIAFPPGKAPIASSSCLVFDLPRGVLILRSQGVCILTSVRCKPSGPATNWQKDVCPGFSPGVLRERRPERAPKSGVLLLLAGAVPAALTERSLVFTYAADIQRFTTARTTYSAKKVPQGVLSGTVLAKYEANPKTANVQQPIGTFLSHPPGRFLTSKI